MNRTDVTFLSHGTRCAAWLYRPVGPAPYPCIVLAHGLGATRNMKLPEYAEHFVEAGLRRSEHWGIIRVKRTDGVRLKG